VRTVEPPDDAAVRAAADVVRRHLALTPVVAVPALGEGVLAKLEVFQPTGSFKVRGALAAVAAAQRQHPGAPLVAASAGNHGLGVACAADRLGAEATVVVAETASVAKVRALERFAVTLVRHGATYDEAEAYALRLAEEKGGHYLSPYNDPDVIAGQATLGAELVAQVPDLATVVLPVGGGGLASGIILATRGTGIGVVGVEPKASAAMSAALIAGRAVPVPLGETIADGLAGSIEEGSVTVDICRAGGIEMHTVDELALQAAVRFLAFEVGVVTEGAGAAAVAAVRSGQVQPGSGATVVVLTGRNIAPPLLASILGG
jgi:threonine dehydratase